MALVRRTLIAILSLIGFAGWLVGNQTNAKTDPEIQGFAQRANIARERLEVLAGKEGAPAATLSQEMNKLAQWMNWPNWPNWGNWPNWANYRR